MHLSKCLGSFAKVWGVCWFGAFRSDHTLLRETAKNPRISTSLNIVLNNQAHDSTVSKRLNKFRLF